MEFKSTKTSIEGDRKIPTLPDSIIMDEILPRLPVKSLIRFQSVSKYWNSDISKNPNFAKLHLKYSSLFRRQFFIRIVSRDFFLLPYKKCSNENDLVELHHYSAVDCTEIVGSCNGLVCLYHREDDEWSEDWERERKWTFELWNPATRQYNEIDIPPGVYLSLACGFGYAPSIDDYKIVASFATEREGEGVFRGFYVFSLRCGEWDKKFSGFDYSSRYGKWRRIRNYSNEDRKKENIVLKLKDQGFWNDGILYWPPENSSSINYIIGFDLATDEFKEYTSMDWKREYNSVKLFRLKGCLALHGRKSNKVSEFWRLKDSHDWGSWQKLFSVSLNKIPFVFISETSKCLVQRSKKFKLVNLRKKALEVAKGVGRSVHELTVMDHVESLVSPFGMTKSTEEEGHLEAIENSVTNTEHQPSNGPFQPLSFGSIIPGSEKNIDIKKE